MNKTYRNFSANSLSLLMLCTVSLLLTGCLSALNPGPAPDRVLLHVKTPATYGKGGLPFQLMVGRPEMGYDLDTDNIALVFDDNLVRYLREAKWASPTPRLVQRMIIDHLEDSHCLSGVVDEGVGVHPRYRLIVHVREFQFNYRDFKAAPAADVMFNLRLVDTDESTILATASIRKSTQAVDGSLRGMIKAMESTISAALDETNAFVINTLEPLGAVSK